MWGGGEVWRAEGGRRDVPDCGGSGLLINSPLSSSSKQDSIFWHMAI